MLQQQSLHALQCNLKILFTKITWSPQPGRETRQGEGRGTRLKLHHSSRELTLHRANVGISINKTNRTLWAQPLAAHERLTESRAPEPLPTGARLAENRASQPSASRQHWLRLGPGLLQYIKLGKQKRSYLPHFFTRGKWQVTGILLKKTKWAKTVLWQSIKLYFCILPD